jgi:hypothetical protein
VLESGLDNAIYKGTFTDSYITGGEIVIVYGQSLKTIKNSGFASIMTVSKEEEKLLREDFLKTESQNSSGSKSNQDLEQLPDLNSEDETIQFSN